MKAHALELGSDPIKHLEGRRNVRCAAEVDILLLLSHMTWETGRSPEKGIMFIPLLRAIAGRIVAIEPHHERYDAVILRLRTPVVTQYWIPDTSPSHHFAVRFNARSCGR